MSDSGAGRRPNCRVLPVLLLLVLLAPGFTLYAADPAESTDVGETLRRYGPRILVTGSLLAWGILAPDQFDTLSIEIPPGEPRAFNSGLDTAGTVAAFLAMGTSAGGRLLSDWPNALDSLTVSSAVIATAYASRSYLKAVFDRQRPSVIDPGATQDPDDRNSFPSGHTVLAWACVGDALVGTVRRQVDGWVLATVAAEAIGVACLRVAAGEHYPGDVVAGAAIGLAVGSLVSLVMPPL